MAMNGKPNAEGQARGKIQDDEIIDLLERQFEGFPAPTGLFDPSTARPEQLRHFGLPPKPDPSSQPLLYRAWNKGFGKSMTLQEFKFTRGLVEGVEYRPLRASPDISFAETRFETSGNWSGAYITANQDRQFMQVWGSWTVPGNLQLPPPLQQGPADIPYICSNWIGLDGQRLYLDSSLPQIGTASKLEADATTTAQAWTQWWGRGNPKTLPLPLGLPVNPGDEVLCVVTACDPRTVVFVMVNLTGVPNGMAVKGTSPLVPLPDGTQVKPAIAGATAEWIMERPNDVDDPGTRCNFPDYGHSKFDFCIAVEAANVDIFSLFTGLPQVLRGEHLIRMFDVLPDPDRTTFISMPTKRDDFSVHVKYGGF
jgi:Peptidase A4 family